MKKQNFNKVIFLKINTCVYMHVYVHYKTYLEIRKTWSIEIIKI